MKGIAYDNINGDWHRAETIDDCCDIVEQFLGSGLADIIRGFSLTNEELKEQYEDYEEEILALANNLIDY